MSPSKKSASKGLSGIPEKLRTSLQCVASGSSGSVVIDDHKRETLLKPYDHA